MAASAAVLALGLAIGAAAPASATITYPPEGGRWNHGADADTVWSIYYHPSKIHKASTYGASGSKSSGWKSSNTTASCVDGARLFGNKAYYDVL
ncbi:hypothetical protein GCM10009751_23280 [Myceligenerans crystallogenes]|uniref:Lactococcin 972 family bacteriocin n=1 Tax=Myceligenerans crystallogenes TaxID=316335 RepID=A0ABN2NFU9_9MICO